MKYRKKPGEVEAMRFDGTVSSAAEIMAWGLRFPGPGRIGATTDSRGDQVLVIHTLHGPTTAIAGDWVVRGSAGDFWPCQPYIFDATYEAVA